MQFFYCVQFDDHAIFDNEVDSAGSLELNAVVDDRKPYFMRKREGVFRGLITKTGVVER